MSASNEGSPVVKVGRLSVHARRPRNYFAGDSITQIPSGAGRARAATVTKTPSLMLSPLRRSSYLGSRTAMTRPVATGHAPESRLLRRGCAQIDVGEADIGGDGAISTPYSIDQDAPVNWVVIG